VGEAAAQAIAGTEGIDRSMFPIWSPDSQQIAFLSQGHVRRVALSGGLPAVVVAASPNSGVWLKDGDLLLAIAGKGLMRVPAAGGALRDASGFTSDDFRNLLIDGLDVSPDGRTLLFTQFGGETGLYVASIDGGEKRLLVPGEQNAAVFASPDHIVRADATGLVAQRFDAKKRALVGDAVPVALSAGASDFAGSTGGALSFMVGAETLSRMTWFTREGKADGVLGPDALYQEVAISRDGKLLAFARTDANDGNVDIWVQAPSGGAPRRLTADADIDHRPVLSHDGCCIAWESHAKGLLNLMERPVDGSAPARLIRTWGKAGGPSDWSVNGSFVIYQSSDGPTGSNLWAVPREGKGEPTRLTQPGFGADDGQFSPDGRFLAFTGRETGETEVYVQRVEGMKLAGGPIRVSEGGGQSPQWGRGGSELYFVNDGTIFVVPFDATAERPAGAPRALFTIPSFGGARPEFRNFAPMPDGRRFVALVSVVDPTPHPATIILNWGASLGGKP
jgi:Tol biopolymer transport system component